MSAGGGGWCVSLTASKVYCTLAGTGLVGEASAGFPVWVMSISERFSFRFVRFDTGTDTGETTPPTNRPRSDWPSQNPPRAGVQ